MKASITFISVAAILVCLAAFMQTKQHDFVGSLAEQFRQFDSAEPNRDGRVTPLSRSVALGDGLQTPRFVQS